MRHTKVLIVLSLLFYSPSLFCAETQVYRNKLYGFELQIPSDYKIRGFNKAPDANDYRFSIVNGNSITNVNIMKYRRCDQPGQKFCGFDDIAETQAGASCSSDGEDCSNHCETLKRSEVGNNNGLRAYRYELKFISSCGETADQLDPVYVIDISNGAQSAALFFQGPVYSKSEHGVDDILLSEIVKNAQLSLR